MATPTQNAEYSFEHAKKRLQVLMGEAYGEGSIPVEQREALIAMCEGLGHLSKGIRATYALLEEVKTELIRNRMQP